MHISESKLKKKKKKEVSEGFFLNHIQQGIM